MKKRKNYPLIKPLFVKDQTGKNVEVILKFEVYESIIDEMNDLQKKITSLKKHQKELEICKNSSHIPNKDTREAIKELEAGKNLTRYKSVDDMLKRFNTKKVKSKLR